MNQSEPIGPEEIRLPPRHNQPYDAPDAATLVASVRDYLHDDLMPRTEGADRWLLRVAANALSIAGREMELGPIHREAHLTRLNSLGMGTDRDLAEAIRRGDLDERWTEVSAAVRASVADSLSVANPSYSIDD